MQCGAEVSTPCCASAQIFSTIFSLVWECQSKECRVAPINVARKSPNHPKPVFHADGLWKNRVCRVRVHPPCPTSNQVGEKKTVTIPAEAWHVHYWNCMALAADGDGDDACCYYFHCFHMFSPYCSILVLWRQPWGRHQLLSAPCNWQDAYGQRSDAAASESVLARICKPSNQLYILYIVLVIMW